MREEFLKTSLVPSFFFFFFFFFSKRFSKMLVLKMKSMSLTTCLFGVSFFSQCWQFEYTKINKTGTRYTCGSLCNPSICNTCLQSLLYSAICVICFPWNTRTRDSDGNEGENLIGFEAQWNIMINPIRQLWKTQYIVAKFAVIARLNSHLVSLLNYLQEPWYM